MERQVIYLWDESEKHGGASSGAGTFHSCNPSITSYPAEDGHGRGTVIVCPGGGYEFKADHEGEPVALWLNSIGINAYVLDYRVNPDIHPAPMMDVRRAISTARKLAPDNGASSGHVAVLGFSAGGHLAACSGTMWDSPESRPDAMVLCYPVISFGKYGHVGSRINLLGETANSASISDMSLENRVDRQTPPAFIWHTADDELVPVENSLMFASALAAKQVHFSCHVFPNGEHGLGLAGEYEKINIWTKLCADFLQTLGF